MQTYFAKSIHGGHRVRKLDSGVFEVNWPSGDLQYPSIRKTLIAIVNRDPNPGSCAKDPKVGFSKYFKLDRTPKIQGQEDVIAMFRPKPEHPIGIDLKKRGHEVAKLFYAGFARSCANYGYDPEDVLQEVYKGILIRNAGTCPWDSRKSSFGHYVHLIIKCVLANYHRKWSRVSDSEQLGSNGVDGEANDVASCNFGDEHSTSHAEMMIAFDKVAESAVRIAIDRNADVALTRDVALRLAQGYRRSELGALYEGYHRPYMIDRAVGAVREAAAVLRD